MSFSATLNLNYAIAASKQCLLRQPSPSPSSLKPCLTPPCVWYLPNIVVADTHKVEANTLSEIGRESAIVDGKIQLPLRIMLSRVPRAEGADAAKDFVDGACYLTTVVLGIGHGRAL